MGNKGKKERPRKRYQSPKVEKATKFDVSRWLIKQIEKTIKRIDDIVSGGSQS